MDSRREEPVSSCRPRPQMYEELEALDARITELATHIHAATYRWLCLVREFDDHPGVGAWGLKSTAHYLNWRCGIGLTAAREHVRVSRALPGLSKISEAFSKGVLSYSKVRAITRVATLENEDYFLELATYGTASHIERLVREYRQVRVEAGLDERKPAPVRRTFRYHWDEDGMLVFSGRLAPEEGALVLKALEAGRRAIEKAGREDDNTDEAAEGREPTADASAESCSEKLYDDSPHVENRASDGGERYVNEEQSRRACEHHTGAEATGHDVPSASAESFPHAVCPRLTEVYDEIEADEPFGAKRADALVRMAHTFLAHDPTALSGADRYQVVLHVSAEAFHEDGPQVRRALEDGPGLFKDTARRIACDASTVTLTEDADSTPLNLGRKTRRISPALRRALTARDGGCRFPGCTERRYVDAHHVVHWADGGETSLSNLLSLCSLHHGLLHEGGFTVGRSTSGKVVFHRRDGQLIPAAPTLPALNHAGRLERLHGELAFSLAPDACTSKWDGAPMDHSAAIEGLLTCDLGRTV